MDPGDLYQLAIVVAALFVAPFNAMARIVVLAWIAGHAAYLLGVPEIVANIAGQVCVLLVGLRHLRAGPDRFAWAMSLPLLVVNVLWFGGVITPWVAWWTVLLVAMVQLMILSLSVNGEVVHAVMKIWREHGGRGMFKISARL